jgi:hypothetical protein
MRARLVEDIFAAFASIRAEGSAERAKLEAAWVGTDAEINIVEAMIDAYHRARGESDQSRFCEVWRIGLNAALAQPAESGATERERRALLADLGPDEQR